SYEERLRAIQTARQLKQESSCDALLKVATTDSNELLVNEAIRALGELGGGDEVAQSLLKRWPQFSANTRRIAAEVLVSRRPWAKALLSAIEQKDVSPGDISATAVRILAQNSDQTIRS